MQMKCFLTSPQQSAEVTALQRALYFYLSFRYVFLQFVVYASLILDTLPFMQAKVSVQLIAPDKATKQSRDLKCVLFLLIYIHIIEVQTE